MYPIRFEPIYQPYVWGGERIKTLLLRKVQDGKIAESWEISDREDGMSVCINGPLKGKTLHTIVQEMKEDLLGVGRDYERFPILTKIIDAKEHLSIQVHPDAFSAKKLGGEPKSEMWVALHDSSVLAGLKKGVDQNALKKAIEKKTAEKLLEKIDLKKGDVIFIPGGTAHAISAGSFLYEIQQNSNTTYRLYDWGRDRELHLEKGLEATHFDYPLPEKAEPKNMSSDLLHQMVSLLSSDFFNVERIDIFSALHIAPIPKSFQIFFCMQGDATISVDGNEEPLKFGMTYLVPAACKTIDIKGKCQLLRIRLP